MKKVIYSLAFALAIAFGASAQDKTPTSTVSNSIVTVYKVAGTDLVYKSTEGYEVKSETIESIEVLKEPKPTIIITLTKAGFDSQKEEFRNKFEHEKNEAGKK